jgi:signal transduction histidine kinase
VNDAHPPSPVPSYAEELDALQRPALRAAALLAAPLLLAFSLLDRAAAPERWRALLAIRSIAAASLAAIAWRLRRPAAAFMPHAFAACAALALTLLAGILATGGVHSSYPYAVLLLLAGISILVPLAPAQAIALHATVVGTTMLPLVPLVHGREDALAFATRASFLVCGSILAIAAARAHDSLRRREHLARAEFARHVGLLNLGALAGGLAHELANPLAAAMNELALAADALPDAARPLRGAETALRRMRAILDAMRRGARFADGDQREVDLNAEVDAALVLLRPRLASIEVVRELAILPRVKCQPTLLGQVLVNLVANAVDAVAGKAGARVLVRTRREDGRAVVEVADNGPGVRDELRERIFEPFFSTKGQRGNGLGLWISAEIARVHGGSLTVSDTPDGGASFRLSLPLR